MRIVTQSQRRKDMDLLLIGAQGSGKGTQAEKLSQSLGIPHVASGDLFRKAIDEKTELGIKAKAYMDRGELVPDNLTVPMVLSRIEESDCVRGVLLDSFFNETIHLLDYYGSQQKLVEVNGNLDIDQMQRVLLKEIHDHQESR